MESLCVEDIIDRFAKSMDPEKQKNRRLKLIYKVVGWPVSDIINEWFLHLRDLTWIITESEVVELNINESTNRDYKSVYYKQ